MDLRWRGKTTRHLGVLLGFAAVATLMTYPLAFRMSRSVPGWPGDNLHYVRLLWWFKYALIDQGISPYFNPLVYVPEGLAMARGEVTLANTLLALPLTAAWGPVVAYNVSLLVTFVLTGFATYLWVWRLTEHRLAGVIGGVIFAFCPYRMAHLAGHLPLMPTQWFPFLLYAFEELRRTHKVRFAVWAAFFFAMNAWASWYYLYFSLVLVPVYVALRFKGWRLWLRSRRFWRAATAFSVISLVLTLPTALPFLQFHDTGQMQHRFNTMEKWSANPTDFFVPNLLHPLWGEALRRLVPFQWELWVEKSLSLGTAPLVLATVALVKRWAQRSVRSLGCIALVSFLLALGPTLHWAGQRVHLEVPTGLMALLYHVGVTPYLARRLDPVLLSDVQLNHYAFIPLPMLFFYLFVPFTNAMRSVGRFGLLTILAVAGLAGQGTLILDQRWRSTRIRSLLLVAVGLLIIVEFWSLPYEMTDLAPRPVDLWLAEQSTGAVVELPVTDGLPRLKDYFATVHQQPTVFGPTNLTFIPQTFEERRKNLSSFPDAESIAALEAYEATYILVHTEKIDAWPEQIEDETLRRRLHLLRCFDTTCVYTLGSSLQ
ncbi:MAG: hypothetical protein ACOC6F_00830 [bacterium]